MQPTVLYVFVSSTRLHLQPQRAAVETALQRLRETKFVGMEYFSDLYNTLTPIITAFGGPEAVVETFRAIQDVGRRWP